MRVLALLFALLSLPVLAADHTHWPDQNQGPGALELAQHSTPPSSGDSGQQSPNSGPKRYPGDYCCRHCRHDETPCGDECLPKGKSCAAKKTCACPGKP